MSRKEELDQACADIEETQKAAAVRIIDEMLFLEDRLTELKDQPFLAVNPRNPMQQRQTAAAKQYKELLQQYTNCVKILLKLISKNGDESDAEEDSPLRSWMKDHMKN